MLFSKKKRDISYIKIWENIYGTIPLDSDGRRMEIHHIDGNKHNNKIENLQLVTIKEHYNIHLTQGDYSACQMIAVRMNKTPAEISDLARLAQLKKVNDGTHHLLGPTFNKKRVEDGTHHWLDGKKSSETQSKLVKSGKHQFVDSDWQRKNQLKLVNDGRHNFAGGDLQRSLVDNGTHHFVTNNPGKYEWICEYCLGKGQGKTNYTRWHGTNCKQKKTP